MSTALPTDTQVKDMITSALYNAIDGVGEFDEVREAAEYIIQNNVPDHGWEVDQDLDHEDQLDELRAQIQDVLDTVHFEVRGMDAGYHFDVDLIYTSDIEDYYSENMSECDEYYWECKDMADGIDSLKSMMVSMARNSQALNDVYGLTEAIEDIDPEDII